MSISRHTRGIIAASLTLSVIVTGCSRADNVLSDGKMSDVIADLQLAEAYMSTVGGPEFITDSSRKVLRQSILADNDVTEEQYSASIDWYGHNLDRYTKLHDQVREKLEKRLAKVNKSSGKEAEKLPDLWPLERMITLAPQDYSGGFSFSVPVSDVAPGTTLEWTMKLTQLAGNARLLLGAEYGDLDSEYTTYSVSMPGKASLLLNIDKKRKPRKIFGYLHLGQRPNRMIWVDSIRLVNHPAGKAGSAQIPAYQGYASPARSFRIPGKGHVSPSSPSVTPAPARPGMPFGFPREAVPMSTPAVEMQKNHPE